MQIEIPATGREQRRNELMKLWKDQRSRLAVLGLFHSALPEGERPRAGMSVFDVILEHEFGHVPARDEVGEA